MDREEARARMLRLWMTASTSDAARTSIHTTQGTVVHTDKLITNAGQTLFACTNLATPLGTYTHAVLRDHDVAQMEWPLTTSELRALLLDDMDKTTTYMVLVEKCPIYKGKSLVVSASTRCARDGDKTARHSAHNERS
ncbi:hypothetical protein PC128_g4423 [Phytophthora cactorum]|nr:hypothetical protein PC128_g4423 [Phytophthora cactorum]